MDDYVTPLLVALGFGVLTAGTFTAGRYGVRRIFVGSPKDQRKQEEMRRNAISSLEAVTSIGNMHRIWYDEQNNVYRDATGRQVHGRPLGRETKRYTPSELRHLSLEDFLTEMQIKGEVIQEANAFSFTESMNVHRDYVFGVLYHQV